MNSDLKCRDEDGNEDDVFLIVLIKSRLENFDQRNMIRRTWGRQFGTNHVNIRRVFLLGVNPNNKKLQQRIGIEQQDYDDIVQQFFIDHYFNNTLKMIMGFKWAVNFCKNARFVAFFDDDYYVNMKKVTELLNAVKKEDYDNTIVGMVWRNAMPYRIKNNKWYVSLDEYPYRFWPDYVTAGSFFVPMPTAERINLALQYVKLIRFDDVFLGVVAYKLGIKLQHSNNLVYYDMAYDKYKFRNIIAAHGFKDVEFLYKVWKEQRDIDAIS
ncbi:hypothetical protein HELRODRAFT_84672 [Helobdella robusta]|uniref:Hexosyltransferase n=1 Tax=Helobdella robusta TaxID=6412 RepID=T1G5L7_HELRO|nr:hypothetical protein HELRODRAFT_84672 [Helobdella robusta]ESN98253.1 hypothetical protein HELRODRAFT_84672 [Helobdella robusta]